MAKALKFAAIAVGAVALAFTGVGLVAGLGAAATGFGIGVSASTLFLVAGGLSVAAGLLQKAPKVTNSQTDRLTANIDPRTFRKTVLGQTAMPVDVRYEEWSGNDQEICEWIVAFASHAIDGLDEIWFDTEMAWSAATGVVAKYNGYFSIPNLVLESTPQNAFSFGQWNRNSARLTGCAYARFRFKVTGNSKKAESPFSSGIPSRITAIGRGAKLYDPRRDSTVPGGSGPMRADDQSTWRFTTDDGVVIGENLPLQILRVILGWRIRNPSSGVMKLATGAGVPARRISLPSFQIAANLADELVNRAAGGNEPRYHGAGVISEGDDQKTVLDMLCSACCGRFRDTGGKLALAISHNDLAAAAVDDGLNDDDVVGAFTWDPDPSMESTPNVVRGRYVDASSASLYQLIDYPEVRLPSPDGQDRFLSLDLGVVESPSHAQRVAKQVLQRRQYSRQFAAPFDIRAWKYTVGDVVPFTFAPLGFQRGVFRVKEQELGQSGTCNMVLTYETPAFYQWDADDSLPVQGAEPIVYDRGNNPLILAIDEAATTAFWDGVTGSGKPADDATNSADLNSAFGPGTIGGAINQISEFDRQIAAAHDQLSYINATTIPTINQAVADAETRIDAAKKAADDGIGAANTKIDAIARDLMAADAQQETRSTAIAVSAGSPVDFTMRGLFYATDAWQGQNAQLADSFFVADGSGSYHYLNAVSGGSYSIALRRPLPFAGKVYRIQAQLRALGADGTYSADFEWSNNQTGAQGGSYAGFTALPVSAGWVTIDYVIDGTNRTDIWLNAHLRGSVGTGGKIEIAYFRCLDITTAQSISAVNARVGTEETVRQRDDLALSRRIDSVAASGGYDDTAVYAEVRRVDQAAISRDGSIGQRIDSVIANYQADDRTTNARVEQVATSASDATKAVADLSDSVNSRFSGVNTTLSGYDGRLTTLSTDLQGYAARTGTIETTVGPADSSKQPLMARVATAESAIASFPGSYAAASRAAALEAQVDGTADSRLLGRANDQASVIADAKVGVVAQSVQTLSASIGGYNLIANTTFVSTDGWVFNKQTPASVSAGTDAAGDLYHPPGEHVLSLVQGDPAGADKYCEWQSPRFPVSPSKWYQYYAFINSHRCHVDAFFVWFDANNNFLGATPSQSARGPGGNGNTEDGYTRIGQLAAKPIAGAISGALWLRKYDTAAGETSSYAWFRRPYVAEVREGQNSWNPFTGGTGAALEASVVQQAGVLAGLDGRTSVYWSVTGTTPDGSTKIQLIKSDGSAGLFYIGANLLVDGNAIFNGTVTIRALDRSTMTATTSGSVSGTYGGAGSPSLIYIPNLGADMAIKSGGSLYFTFTGNISATTDATGSIYASFEVLNAADNSVLASIRLPTPGFGPGGRLDNFVIRILNVWGDLTIRWRVASRATDRTWSIVQNPQCSVYWTAL